MKLDAGRIEAFLKNPILPIVLLHGPDAGLVAERGLALVRSVDGVANDPFRFAELHNPSGDTLLAEATAAAMTGGRRVIRVREIHESHGKAIESLIKSPPDALIILEAGELTGKSKLRASAEKAAGVAVIACYVIDQSRLPQTITTRLRAGGIQIDQDAAAWAAQNLTGEEGPLGQALEVLTLYAGAEKRLGIDDVSAILADGGESSMNDAIDAVITGDPAAADRALHLAYDEGISPVGLLRVLLGEFMRLRVAIGAITDGASAQEAMSAMRPPVFFKRQALIGRALKLWSPAALDQALAAALTAETACKTTRIPEHDYCRQAMLSLALRARTAARR